MKQVKSNPMENVNKEVVVSYDLEAQVAELNRQLEAKAIITESGGVKAGVDIVLLR